MKMIELSILMPCLNERETLATCIRKAKRFLETSGIPGEVVIADNGSVDGSQAIAEAEGARVVAVPEKGYGAALLGGIAAAKGRYVIMGDADDSYDFSALQPFVDRLRGGADLVMGNRFAGGIGEGAMPFLHRYLGNPVLSWLGRRFFAIPIGDFHCGLRGFDRQRIMALGLRATGMEFASEMIVRAALDGYVIEEVPTTLKKDGRSRAPHLRTWRDGWRHLRFLLMFSPKWLFLYPGFALVGFGLFGAVLLLPGSVAVGNVRFDIHTFIVACVAVLVGLQSISFAAVSRRFAALRGFLPPLAIFGSVLEAMTLEVLLIIALLLGILGLAGTLWCVYIWASEGFGPLQYAYLLRTLMISLTAIAGAAQLFFTAFLAAIMEIPAKQLTPSQENIPVQSEARAVRPEEARSAVTLFAVCTTAVLGYVVLAVILNSGPGLSAWLASAVASTVMVLSVYLIQRNVIAESLAEHEIAPPRYVIALLAGTGVCALLSHILIAELSLAPPLGFLAAGSFTAYMSFSVAKRWVLARKSPLRASRSTP
jgi:glycosyltransferase involved in cell wall biosynthesis